MTEFKYAALPELQEPSKTADPRTRNALVALAAFVNGNIDSFNLKNEGIAEEDLNAAVKALLNQKSAGLSVVGHSISVKGVAGELAIMGASGITYECPTPTINTTVAVFCGSSATSVKVTAPAGAKFFGDFVNGATTLTLATDQHVTLTAEGSNYLIVGGTPAPAVVGTTGSAGPNIASWGLIGSAGAIEAGSGDYTVSNPSEGKYIVTWKTAKTSANYAVVATAASLTGGAGAIPVAVIPTITAKEFVVELYTPGGAHVSDKFSFMAMAGS